MQRADVNSKSVVQFAYVQVAEERTRIRDPIPRLLSGAVRKVRALG